MNGKEKKILNDESLEDVAGGRAYTLEEQMAMAQFTKNFNERMANGDVSDCEREYVDRQIRFYSLYIHMLDVNDTRSYLFNMNKDWEEQYMNLRSSKTGDRYDCKRSGW